MAGEVADFNDYERIKTLVEEYYKRFTTGTLNVNPVGIEQYSRRNVAAQMASVLDGVVNVSVKPTTSPV